MPNGAVFAGRVQPLQHDQQSSLVLGIEKILQLVEPPDRFIERVLHLMIFVPTERVLSIPLRQLHLLARLNDQFIREISSHLVFASNPRCHKPTLRAIRLKTTMLSAGGATSFDPVVGS